MSRAGRFRRTSVSWLRRALRIPQWAAVPAGEVVYAVGDIHGRADLLDCLLGRIANDAAGHPDDHVRRLIFLGDYVDRGSASRAVIDRLLEQPLPGIVPVYLTGNHEHAMLDFLDARSDGRAWLSYGGAQTLMSYGVPLGGHSHDALRDALRLAMPAAHVAFLRQCVLHYQAGDYVFVHAGVRPGVPLDAQDPHDLLWIRHEFLDAREAMPGKVIVHGHTVCTAPEDLAYRVNVDTGAFFSDRLTCLVLRSNTRRFLTAHG